MKKLLVVIIILGTLGFAIKYCSKSPSVVTTENTTLFLINQSKDSVTVYLTLGSDTDYVTNVFGIYGIADSGLQGSFQLAPNDTVYYTSPKSKGFAGNLSFDTPPLNCADTVFPLGVNVFEFALNNNFASVKDAQETIDISCVAGVNCKIGCKVDTLSWNDGSTNQFTYFENSFIYDNVGRRGVYPVGCDDCTASVSPPVCPKPLKPSQPQSNSICNIQRDASKKGGKVFVFYKGKLKGEIN